MQFLELKGSGDSKFLSNLMQVDIIELVSGRGKGKYNRMKTDDSYEQGKYKFKK